MGSIAVKIRRCSIVLVRLVRSLSSDEVVSEDWPEKKILVLLDGSERAEQVFTYVVNHARMSYMQPWYGYQHPQGWKWHRRQWALAYAQPWAFPSKEKEEEIVMLEEQAKILERELESIRKRLKELKKQEVKNA